MRFYTSNQPRGTLYYCNSSTTLALKMFLFHILITLESGPSAIMWVNEWNKCLFSLFSKALLNPSLQTRFKKRSIGGVFICLCVCERETEVRREGWAKSTYSVSINMGAGRRATLFEHGTLVDPLHNYSSSAEANNGILPLSLCKHKLHCWTMDLRVALFTAGCLSCVCQWREKNLSRLGGQFYWFAESFSNISRASCDLSVAALLFVLSLALCVRSKDIHRYKRTYTHTFVHTIFSPLMFHALLFERAKWILSLIFHLTRSFFFRLIWPPALIKFSPCSLSG